MTNIKNQEPTPSEHFPMTVTLMREAWFYF